jgi:hypothetical protein
MVAEPGAMAFTKPREISALATAGSLDDHLT